MRRERVVNRLLVSRNSNTPRYPGRPLADPGTSLILRRRLRACALSCGGPCAVRRCQRCQRCACAPASGASRACSSGPWLLANVGLNNPIVLYLTHFKQHLNWALELE